MADSTPNQSLLVDHRRRWQQGDRVGVEALLRENPDLGADPERVLELIYQEVVLREEAGEAPQLDEYVRRFPQFDAQLRLQFEVHQALRGGRPSATSVQGRQGGLSFAGTYWDTPAPAEGVSGYEILEELGRGGMGVVYKARQTALKRLVALKMILAGGHASPRARARFKTEAEAVARLQHPHIVQIYEVGECAGRPYISLEYVAGGSLDRLAAGAPQPVRPAARLVETLARAMHYAHQQGIVHRDLKPANILLQRSEVRGQKSEVGGQKSEVGGQRSGEETGWSSSSDLWPLASDLWPKITDFGLAKLLDSESGATPTEALLGTPNYMAPEQAAGRNDDVGPAADVYSLGAILYELLTGRPPFKGATVLDTLEQVRRQEPVPPARLQPTVPADLETICLKCLDKEPPRRYESALALAEDLRRFLAGEPILARPISPWRRGIKWARRRPTVAALLALSTLAVLGVAAVLTWSGIQEARRLKVVRADFTRLWEDGHAAYARREWSKARPLLAAACNRIEAEPALEEFRDRAEALLREAGRRAHAEETHRQFLRHHDLALFHGMNFLDQGPLLTGADRAANRALAEREARRALALAGIDVAAGRVGGRDARFSDRQWDEIRSGSATLLLVLADVAARRPAPAGKRYAEALRLLDLAARVAPSSPVYHRRRADYLDGLGRADEARTERERATRTPPAGARDHFLAGQGRYAKGDFASAAEAFNDALAAQPTHFWARCYLADCYLRLQRWGQARDALTVCLMQRDDSPWIYLLRGLAHQRLGAFLAAGEDFRKAEALLGPAPNESALYILHVNRGVLRDRQGQPDAAAADFRQAVRLRPGDYIAHVNLAAVLEKQQNGAEAAREFEKALRLKMPAVVRAPLLFRLKRYEECVAACRAALAAGSDDPSAHAAHVTLAQALVRLGRHAEAVREFDLYLKKGGRPVPDFYRGRGLARMQLGDYPGALDDYTRVLHAEPDAEIYAHRGWAYFFADAWRLALADFDAALRLDPTTADAHTGRGLARVMLGRYREAVADAEEALRRPPAAPEMMHNLACIFALAVGKAEADPAARDRAALARDYRGRAVLAVRRTLALVPASQRRQFFRDKVLPDPALDSIRSSSAFEQLIKEFALSPKTP